MRLPPRISAGISVFLHSRLHAILLETVQGCILAQLFLVRVGLLQLLRFKTVRKPIGRTCVPKRAVLLLTDRHPHIFTP